MWSKCELGFKNANILLRVGFQIKGFFCRQTKSGCQEEGLILEDKEDRRIGFERWNSKSDINRPTWKLIWHQNLSRDRSIQLGELIPEWELCFQKIFFWCICWCIFCLSLHGGCCWLNNTKKRLIRDHLSVASPAAIQGPLKVREWKWALKSPLFSTRSIASARAP